MDIPNNKHTILIIDDNPTNLQVLSDTLIAHEFQVAVAIDGLSALKQLQYHTPDLILLDIMMPGIDGFETCRRLKNNPETADIPIIFMTALADTDSKVKGLALGAVDYITKPFQQLEVLARIKMHLRLRSLTKLLTQQNLVLQQEITQRQQAEQSLQQLNTQLENEVIKRTARLRETMAQLEKAQVELQKKNEELEQRVQERTAQLQAAKETADLASHAKSDFLANMSHEVRTPLNGILGYAEGLQLSPNLSEKEKKWVYGIHRCGTHLLTLINDVLDFSKIEARKLELYPHPFHLTTLIEGVIELFSFRFGEKNIAFQCILDPNLPEKITADEKRLRQILVNLLSNAFKFTESGTIEFCVELVQKTPNPSPERSPKAPGSSTEGSAGYEALIRFTVQDSGIGISPEDLSIIFAPFEQAKENRFKAKGTGLGLAISQRLLALMNSQMQVTSHPAQGSCFWFELCLPSQGCLANSTATLSRRQRIIGFQGDRQRLLIVDDRWEDRTVLSNLLGPLGFELLEAQDGQSAIAQLQTLQPDQLPALLIVDLVMPNMSGFDLIRHLRQSPPFAHLPIIAASASEIDHPRDSCLTLGANAFIPKPIASQQLLDLLQELLALEWVREENISRHVTFSQQAK